MAPGLCLYPPSPLVAMGCEEEGVGVKSCIHTRLPQTGEELCQNGMGVTKSGVELIGIGTEVTKTDTEVTKMGTGSSKLARLPNLAELLKVSTGDAKIAHSSPKSARGHQN